MKGQEEKKTNKVVTGDGVEVEDAEEEEENELTENTPEARVKVRLQRCE